MSDPEPNSPAPDPPPSGFPATRWTLVGRAASGGSAEPLAMAELARLYAPALRAHLLQSSRFDEHRADDLLQGFLADKVLDQKLIAHANPDRGRFRTFLLTALDRYVVDTHRRDNARSRMPRGGVQDVDSQRDSLPDRNGGDRASAFDVAWAREVLGEVLATMQKHCHDAGKPELWEVFVARYLKPATEGTEPETHESLSHRLKLETPHHAANLLVTAKRMFTRIFKSIVSRYAATEAELREEVADLWRIFAASRP